MSVIVDTGPIFRTEDLMNVLKNATIPTGRPRSPSYGRVGGELPHGEHQKRVTD